MGKSLVSCFLTHSVDGSHEWGREGSSDCVIGIVIEESGVSKSGRHGAACCYYYYIIMSRLLRIVRMLHIYSL